MSAVVLVLAVSCMTPSRDRVAAAAATPAGSALPVHDRCALPGQPTVIRRDGAAVLLIWEFAADPLFQRQVLPPDSAFLAYRAAVRADGADVERPVADAPELRSAEAEDVWRRERLNNELAYSGAVGTIEPVTCLDALFFAYQNARFPQLERPTEFLVSLLRRERGGRTELAAVFGAGDQLFPPKSVYGFDVVDTYRSRGWRYWYMLHNHTPQRNGDQVALGSPVLSTSDVQLARSLAAQRGLERARVTNGFYTFEVTARGLDRLFAR